VDLLDLIELRGRGEEPPATKGATITIEGDRVRVAAPEGASATYSVEELARALAPPHLLDLEQPWPPGVRVVRRLDKFVIAVHETPPGLQTLRWIAADSPAPFGPAALYRDVRIALPYVVLVAVMGIDRKGRLAPTPFNETFFATQAVKDLSEPMYYPALLNCSRMRDSTGKCLSWLCVQHLRTSELTRGSSANRGASIVRLLLEHLFHDAFNYSSEHHEGTSWFSETVRARVDPRVATIEAWQEASREDPWFALRVPWLPTQLMLAEVLERTAEIHAGGARAIRTADDVAARLHRVSRRSKNGKKAEKS
jgi:hypothetical protein